MIKAKETPYKGYRFRSRLEARWAVFFDVLGIQWEYEKEGFDLSWAGAYLPDFWFPQLQAWGEVKGVVDEEAIKKPLNLAECHSPVLIFTNIDQDSFPGQCGLCYYDDYDGGATETTSGFLAISGTNPMFVTNLSCDVKIARYPQTGEEVSFIWGFDRFRKWASTSIEEAVNYYVNSTAAFNAARSARFEHGETPNGTN